MKLFPITDEFVAEVGDLDLSHPLSPADEQALKSALWRYGVLVVPEQQLTVEQHLSVARYFGDLDTTVADVRPGTVLRVPREIADVSNLTATAEIWDEASPRRRHELANRLWHTDSSFKPRPALASLLYARSIPPLGGNTEFADMRAAYGALSPEEQAAIAGLVAEHCIRYSRARIGFTDFTPEEIAALPAVRHRLVQRLPETERTRRDTLYLASHAGRIVGMTDSEGAAKIDALIAHSTARQFVYTHRWRPFDLVIWDNRCTMHRGTPFEDTRWERDVQRATALVDQFDAETKAPATSN